VGIAAVARRPDNSKGLMVSASPWTISAGITTAARSAWKSVWVKVRKISLARVVTSTVAFGLLAWALVLQGRSTWRLASPTEFGGCPMEINPSAPATAAGALQINADPQTMFSVLAAIDQWPSWNPDVRSVQLQGQVQPGTVFRRATLDEGIRTVLSRLKAAAEWRAATA
jgi:hypothetical protein